MRLFRGKQGEGTGGRGLPRRALLLACLLILSLLLITDFFLGSSSSGTIYGFLSSHQVAEAYLETSNRSGQTLNFDHFLPPDNYTSVQVPSSSPSTNQDLENASSKGEFPISDVLTKPYAERLSPHSNEPSEDNNYTRAGFVVWSKSCQIPDLDPWHPTIRHLVTSTPPLDCTKGHPPISRTLEVRDPGSGRLRTSLMVDPALLVKAANGSVPRCCYERMVRETDNSVKYKKPCRQLDIGGDSLLLSGEEEEFVRVSCWAANKTKPFFTNFHVSHPDKNALDGRPKPPVGSYSILVLGLDAMSRLNAHRQLPLTLDYLVSELAAVEMKGFQKVGDNTFPNLVPILTGYSEDDLPSHCWGDLSSSFDNCTWLWRRFASVGYKTMYGEDATWMSTFNYLKPGFVDPPTDYYARPYMQTLETELGWNKALNCKRCVGPQSQAEALLNWTRGFVHKFSGSPFFALAWMNTLSHDFLNSASSGDLMIRNLLRDLKEGGHLNRTLLVFMGDHGLRWGSIVETYVGRIEERMPLLTISIPQELEDQHPEWKEWLRYNSHRLCTPFDLHATFMDLFPGKNLTSYSPPPIGPGMSLFSPLPVDRTCEDAAVKGQWCTCQQSEDVSTDDEEVLHVVRYVIDYLNVHFLKAHSQCKPLVLESVTSARLRSPRGDLKGDEASADVFDYSVTFRTEHGGAVFDATVRFVPQNHTHELLGEVSRLNLYGNQSWCVDDAKVRKYCYCDVQLEDNRV